MNKLLIATNNQGKVAELHSLLNNLPVQLITPAEIDLNLDVPEDGRTYAENAEKKALAFAQASGMPSLADDSGLEVEALNGAPGIYSARYGQQLFSSSNIPGTGRSEEKLTDGDRRAYLLKNLNNQARPWKARAGRPRLAAASADAARLQPAVPGPGRST